MDEDALEKSLVQLDENIKTLLSDPKTSTRDLVRGLIVSQRAMIPFFFQVSTNTKKIDKMYPFYQLSAWLLGIVVAANVGVVIGILTHTINLP
jgi:multisubunit Na+/H+ antiporter MnhE subunit